MLSREMALNTQLYGKARRAGLLLATVAGSLLLIPAAQAQTEHITLNTGALNGLGTYYIEYTLTDGSASADGSGSAAVSNFQIAGGALGSVLDPTTGDVTGTLGSGGMLAFVDDGVGPNPAPNGMADFAQAFTVSSSSSVLSFDLALSATSVDTSPDFDDFQMQILDPSFSPIAATGPTGVEFIDAVYDSPTPTPIGYSSADPGYNPAIAATVTAAPEPRPLVGLSIGAAGLLGLGWRARRRTPRCA